MSIEQKRYFESGIRYERQRIIKLLSRTEVIHTKTAEKLIRKQPIGDYMDYTENNEVADALTEYYTTQTGRAIEFSYQDGVFSINGARIGYNEQFDESSDAEDRVKLLYPEVFTDELEDPFGRLGI